MYYLWTFYGANERAFALLCRFAGLYALTALRTAALDAIDALVKDVADCWPSNTYAAR